MVVLFWLMTASLNYLFIYIFYNVYEFQRIWSEEDVEKVSKKLWKKEA